LVGLLCSFGGGLAVGVAYYIGVIFGSAQLQDSSNQIYIILLGGAGGLIGSLIDSLLGATVQVQSLKKFILCTLENRVIVTYN
jgi:uncharacterized membrane protein